MSGAEEHGVVRAAQPCPVPGRAWAALTSEKGLEIL